MGDASVGEAGTLSCPTTLEDVTGKVGFARFLQASPDQVNNVTVWVRPDGLPSVPACPNDSSFDARCPARDAALAARQRVNAQQLDCLLSGLGFRLSPRAAWYEQPRHTTSGRPTPILVAFTVGLDWSQVNSLAANPLVAKIDPAPGAAAPTGFIPLPPAECPTSTEPASTKLMGFDSTGAERQPVIIETVDDGLLPAISACQDGTICDAQLNSLWERTILNTRELTCLKRALDQVVSEQPPTVSYGEATGNPQATPIPPLGQPDATVKAFGFGLTYGEVQVIARHPYVERIWTGPSVQFDHPVPGCPPDVSAPVPTVACTGAREAIDGKISDADRARFEAAGTATSDVLIGVRSGAQICPLDTCSKDPCPARDAVLSWWQAENLASQACVRALIADFGVTGVGDAFWLVDAFEAHLTWDQIQTVASHPHVRNIESNVGGGPPP
jgi:hypothetical protein